MSHLDRRQWLRAGGALAAAPLLLPEASAADALAMEPAALPSLAWPLAPTTPPPVPTVAVIALNRLGFGPAPGDIAAFNALGATEAVRLQTWVDQQLNPAAINDSACDAKLAAANLPTLSMSVPQLWSGYQVAQNVDRSTPLRQVRDATFLRAVYSKRQLFEAAVDFWHNHFSIYAWDYWYASTTWPAYDRDVIRAHALGNFRTLLEGVAKSTAMLYYLDNYLNEDSGPNENWARELFELHAMGAENYAGPVNPISVPKDANGLAVQYCDNDVYEAARCFTGWRVNNGWSGTSGNDGSFQYYGTWHDRFNKLVLGQYIAADQVALKDGYDVLDLVAYHPGTAKFIARKLCRRFVMDNPPQTLVDSIAAVFTANKNAPDQIKQTIRAIALSPEFSATWGEKMKRPYEFAISLLRATNANFTTPTTNNNFYYNHDLMGHPTFARRSPDGFPDVHPAWTNTTSFLYRWRLAYYLINGSINGVTISLYGQMPAGLLTPTAIADFWIDRILGRAVFPASNRTELINFMAQGANPNSNLSTTLIQERVPRLVELIVQGPDFQWK